MVENCDKCIRTKRMIPNDADITDFLLTSNTSEWDFSTKMLVKEYHLDTENVFPVLILDDRTLKGYLQIKKYLEDTYGKIQ